MKVKKLIRLLQAMDPEAKVHINDETNGNYMEGPIDAFQCDDVCVIACNLDHRERL